MDKKIMDTQELSEIRALLGEFEETPPAKKPPQARATPQPTPPQSAAPRRPRAEAAAPRQAPPQQRQAAPRAGRPAETTQPIPRPGAARPQQPQRTAPPSQQTQRMAPPPQAAQPQPRGAAPRAQRAAGQPPAAPQQPSPRNTYNLDEILSEVSGVVEQGASEKAHDSQRPRARPVRHDDEAEVRHPAAPPQRPAKRPRIVPMRPEYEDEEDEDEDDDEYEEIDEREERREARRAHKEAERERRRTAREAKRVSTEEDEEIVIRQPRQAQATCARRAKSLGSRSIVVLIMGLIALYLTLAPGFGLPLPTAVHFIEKPLLATLALLLTQFFAMFAGIDVVGLGFYNLFSAKPDQRVFKAVSLSDSPVLVYSHLDPDDRPRRALKYQRSDNTEFLRELEKPDYAERFSSFYVPIALASAITFSAVSALANRDPSRFFLSFSVMMSVGAPLGILCAAGTPYKNVSRRLLGDGAAIAGARGAQRLRAAKEAVLNDADLFPAGSISIESINNFGLYTDEKLLAYAAAITAGDGLELGHVFADALHRSYGRPVRAGRILRYESGGMSADIGGDSVMLGTAAFLARMGIRAKETKGTENGVFLVVNSYPAGLFNLQYHPSAQAYGGIHTMKRVGLTPVIAAADFNISPAMIASLFELRQGAVDEVPAERAEVYQDPAYVEGDPPGALLSRDSITPYANVFLCADKLAGVVRSNLILGGFAGVSGMLIMFYLTYLAEFTAISPQNVLLYLLLWYIPVLFITYGTRRLD